VTSATKSQLSRLRDLLGDQSTTYAVGLVRSIANDVHASLVYRYGEDATDRDIRGMTETIDLTCGDRVVHITISEKVKS
jgi:hypothetical protein